MYLLSFYVPATHVELVKEAIFATGAGTIDNYSNCCWQTLGQGQFKPLENSQAFIGEKNKLEYVEEYKVELVCTDEIINSAIQALKLAHPYETPAYQVIKMENF